MINFYNYYTSRRGRMLNDAINSRAIDELIMRNRAYDYSSIEHIIIKSPKAAYWYAKYVLKTRWPEAESIIKTDPYCICGYAYYVMHERWYEAEHLIMKLSRYAYEYAVEVMKERWIEAEPYIVKDRYWALHYAEKVKKERWPELEEKMLDTTDVSPFSIYYYTINVIETRWPEAEHIIQISEPEWSHYCREFRIHD